MKAILSTALPIDGREIDISVSFGVDADHQRPMTSRIGSAMLCAEEAARGNDIWKFYDPERLHEAAWQLSRSSGRRLPLVDSLIAGAARAAEAVLVHRDPHMAAIPSSLLTQTQLGSRT